MALSFSRPDPSSPDSVAKASFSTGRRGYEQHEVRDFLRMVAAELARLQERERFLDRELRTAQRNVPTAAVALDEEVVTRMLGEEAARILSTAREAASQIKIRAEEASARLLRESGDEAQRMREEAAVESARRRQDAAADAESELAMAKQQGREMVNEARTYRERVLSELARRREAARQQIEQLVHGRDRLVQAFERARLTSVDVMAELTSLGEPAEYVNLAPTTGPLPVMIPNPPPLATDPADDADEPPGGQVDTGEPVGDPHSADEADGVVVALFAGELDTADTDTAETDTTDTDAPELGVDDTADTDTTELDTTQLDTADSDTADDDEIDDDEIDDDEVDADAVDDLFARLRAARAESVAQRVGLAAELADEERAGRAPTGGGIGADAMPPAHTSVDEEATRALTRPEGLSVFAPSPEAPPTDDDVDASPFGRRDAALTPIIVACARKLKRVLADEQNDVLHTLRGTTAVTSIDVMLADEQTHVQRYTDAVVDDLHEAALAGARSLSTADDTELVARLAAAAATSPAVDALAGGVVVPLRGRLGRATADAGGDSAELAALVRAIYREWKVQQIDDRLDDVVRIAFGRGAFSAVDAGTPVQWTHDARFPVCADCDDNALTGVIPSGEPFATGQPCAPAHDGCRCMLAIGPR